MVALSTLRAARILLRSPLFKRLTLCMMLTGVVSEGLQDLLVQYLKLKIGFGVADVVSRGVSVLHAAALRRTTSIHCWLHCCSGGGAVVLCACMPPGT